MIIAVAMPNSLRRETPMRPHRAPAAAAARAGGALRHRARSESRAGPGVARLRRGGAARNDKRLAAAPLLSAHELPPSISLRNAAAIPSAVASVEKRVTRPPSGPISVIVALCAKVYSSGVAPGTL